MTCSIFLHNATMILPWWQAPWGKKQRKIQLINESHICQQQEATDYAMYMMHFCAGMYYIMIYQLAKDMFYMGVCCCSNSSASLNSVDQHGFFGAVIHLSSLNNFRWLNGWQLRQCEEFVIFNIFQTWSLRFMKADTFLIRKIWNLPSLF